MIVVSCNRAIPPSHTALPDLVSLTADGLYCEAGGFHIDPWRSVARALVTHAHSDHARPGSRGYLTAESGAELVRMRTGSTRVEGVAYGEERSINGVRVSFHPAGHILGSAQIRLEHRGEVWVVTGDYKTDADPSCAPFELVPCHTLITESTFALPIYRWSTPASAFGEIDAWWRANAAAGRTSLLFGYALGKAQRLLAGVDDSIGPIFTHGAVERLNDVYRTQGIQLPETRHFSDGDREAWSRGLIVAPQSANGSLWMRRFGDASTAFASGWMTIRGRRRQRSVDRGFVLSDHVDWPQVLSVIEATGAARVLATHGYTDVLVRYLREQGLRADALQTEFRGEDDQTETEDEAITGADGEADA